MDESATGATLGAGKESVYLCNSPFRPFGLVLQLAYKLTPVGIGYMLCQFWILDHVLSRSGTLHKQLGSRL